jgi:NADPH:quinone reductase-like Zn-dependent oxidoreductase
MKAIVCRKYGPPDVLKYEEIDKPTPRDDEVLIRVRAASVNPVDRLFEGTSHLIRLLTGLRKPRDPRIGTDVAGEIEAVGKNVTQFKPGDEVFGGCRGAFAEYACASQSNLALKAPTVSFEQAASVPVAGLTALQGLRDKGKLRTGQTVLINGAAGGVGTFAVQIAKSFGAHVTGVCSTRNVEMVRSIGGDCVIDYTREDFTKSAERYDLIFDLVANHSLVEYRRMLNPKGVCVLAGGPKTVTTFMIRALKGFVLSRLASQNFVTFIASLRGKDLTIMGELMAASKLRPVIDRRYRLSEVTEAIRYLEQGHARGKIILTVERHDAS